MDREATAEFVRLLEGAQQGAVDPCEVRNSFRPNPEQGYCLWNLFEQFASAFMHSPGRLEALAPVLKLACKISAYPSDDTLQLFREPEWAELLAMRGPIETVSIFRCKRCFGARAAFVDSDSGDHLGAVCDSCGDVLFQSVYDERPFPECGCGGQFRKAATHCERCGGTDEWRDDISPYQYFGEHRWVRRGT